MNAIRSGGYRIRLTGFRTLFPFPPPPPPSPAQQFRLPLAVSWPIYRVMQVVVLSSSLNPRSRSRLLARGAEASLRTHGVEPRWLDLADYSLPVCDGGSSYGHPDTLAVNGILEPASAVVVATPVYNYNMAASLKNAIELGGSKIWSGKVVAFVCAAGGGSSYMALTSVANSLMLDFRTVILPRFVYATGAAFDDHGLVDSAVKERLDQLASDLIAVARALEPQLAAWKES